VSTSGTSTRSGGVDLPTLVVTAIASAAAAYVTSVIWAPGTLAAAAFTPVLVALLKEALFKPVEVVTRAVPVRGVVRSAPAPGQDGGFEQPRETPEEIEERIAQLGEAPGASRAPVLRWKAAIVTGLLGFLVAAVIITVPELASGNSLFGGERDTTFFSKQHSSSGATDTHTTTTPPTTTEPQTETVPPASTVTIAPQETITVPPPAPSTTLPEEDVEPPPPPVETTPEQPATP
jgi:hypothetical protein